MIGAQFTDRSLANIPWAAVCCLSPAGFAGIIGTREEFWLG